VRRDPTPRPDDGGRGRPRRARIGVNAAFAAHSAVAGSWGPRIPAIKEHTRLSDGELGVALTGFAAGLLIGTRLAGWPLERFGSRAVIRVATPIMAAALIGPALAGDLFSLSLALFVLGVASGLLDVAMNAQAVAVERAHRRPLMSSIHATWSIGLLVAAGTGAGAAALEIPTTVHFALAALVVAGASFLPLLGLLPRHAPEFLHPDAEGQEVRRRRTPAIVALALIGFGSFFGEGAAADWSAVYLDGDLGSSDGVAALGFVGFSLGMASTRLVGDRLASRFGATAVVRAGGLVAAVGLVLGLAVPTPATAVAGFGLLGMGLAPVVPLTFSAAGNTRLGDRGTALGWVVTVSYLGAILGPIVIGLTAEWTSLRLALGFPAVLAVAIALAARFVGSAQVGEARVGTVPSFPA
jgi:MFS family permease